MPDIILAEVNGGFWLVRGAQHVDDLLANRLAPDLTVEVVEVANRREISAMWTEHEGDADPGGQPWIIHPAIGRRLKGVADPRSVVFTAWSAMLDAAAQEAIDGAGGWLRQNERGRLSMRQYAPAEAEPGLADLQRLRAQLVCGALARTGADAAAIDHETRPSRASGDIDRIDFIMVIAG